MKKKVMFVVLLGMLVSLFAAVLVGCSSGEEAPTAPENLQYDGSTISWNAVQNADSYTVRINDGKEYKVTVPSYPYDAAGQQFNVAVKALAKSSDEVIESEESTKSFVPLGTINEVRFSDEGIPSWDPIENATGYRVKIDGVEVNAAPNPAIVATTYTEMKPGTHSFQVRAVVAENDSYYSKWSLAKSVTILEPVAKEGIVYSDGWIKWGYVSGAQCYEVSVNGTPVTSNCTATQFQYDAGNNNFEVTVKAIGNRASTFDAKTSEAKKFVFLATVTAMNVEDGIVHWDAIPDATGYKIKVNGVERKEILTEPLYDKLPSNTTTTIRVMPISSDTTYFSDWSAEKSFLILPAPVLQWNTDYQLDGEASRNTYWDAVPGASGYAVRLTNPDGTQVINAYGESERAYLADFLQVGTYKVEAKALAPAAGNNIYDSVYSAPINVTRLAAPKALDKNYITSNAEDVTEGFTVTFQSVAGATGYQLYKDNVKAMSGSTSQFTVTNVVDRDVTDEQTYNYKVQSLGQARKVGGQWDITLNSLSNSSEALSFSINVLATPQNINMSGFTFSYGAIQGNNGYIIDVEGQSYGSGGTDYDLSMLQAGVFHVSVCAKGNGADVLASNYSAPLEVQRLEAPSNIHVETSDASEGVLGFNDVHYARSYSIVFNNDGTAVPVSEMMNINEKITEQGTTVYMVSEANYFNDLGTVYYMTSQPSTTANFIKLGAPTFGDVAFTDTQFMWNPSYNINTQIYTPTYQVYDEFEMAYNGDKNGTTMNISNFKGGQMYTFYVKAIGNGTNYVNSELSQPITIWKLATPEVERGNGTYEWAPVPRATNYAVNINGNLVQTFAAGETKYSYTPKFDAIDTYQVDIYAIGDGGYNTIRSDANHIDQRTAQLNTPEFSARYTQPYYTVDGQIEVTITTSSAYATGYSYTIGGATNTSAEHTYSLTPNSVGKFEIRVFALGGSFDLDGVYYINSQSRGGVTIILLATPNASNIEMSREGGLTWTAIKDAIGYEIEIAGPDGQFSAPVRVNSATYTIPNYAEQYQGKHIEVRIRAIGNGITIISSETVVKTWG